MHYRGVPWGEGALSCIISLFSQNKLFNTILGLYACSGGGATPFVQNGMIH